MEVYLVDGTYELFRAYFALPKLTGAGGRPVGALTGLVRGLLALLRDRQVTHIGCAFDHQITSFRNDLLPGYKTGAETPPDLLAQFEPAEQAAAALGLACWPMTEFEADDAIAAAVAQLRLLPEVERIIICTPDKDLAQLVEGQRVVCLDRRRNEIIDEAGVWAKYGVAPASIPDLLALTGDSADGIPGLPGWGAKSAAALLANYGHLEAAPPKPEDWQTPVRGAARLSGMLSARFDEALLYRTLATLRPDAPVEAAPAALEWRGSHRARWQSLCQEWGTPGLAELPHRWQDEPC